MIELSEIEQQVIDSVAADAHRALAEHQQAQVAAQQKYEALIGMSTAANKVIRALLVLKTLNPDAHEWKVDPETGRVTINPKAQPVPEHG